MSAQAAANTLGTGMLPLRELLRGMRRVRAFEERVGELFSRAALPRHSQLYIGEEAVAVGTCLALTANDYVTSTHRGHGHLIAKGAAIARETRRGIALPRRWKPGWPRIRSRAWSAGSWNREERLPKSWPRRKRRSRGKPTSPWRWR